MCQLNTWFFTSAKVKCPRWITVQERTQKEHAPNPRVKTGHMILHLPARLPCWRKHEMRLFADVGMEHGPLVLAIPTSTSVVRKLKKLWMLLLWLLQNPDGVMKLFTSKVVNDLPWILLWQGGWSVCLEQFFGCHLYETFSFVSCCDSTLFQNKNKLKKNSHLMFNVCSSKLMDVFNSKHLRLNFYQS